MIPFETHEVEAELKKLKLWSYDPKEKKIHKELKFNDFKAAFSFMTHIAFYAEQNDHHPEWFNVYNKIKIELNTHDAAGVTVKDIKLAQFIDGVYSNV